MLTGEAPCIRRADWDVMEQDQKFTIRIMAAAAFPHFGLSEAPPPTYNPEPEDPEEAV